jgi:pimeloyl-ACP methyl ester carboxylesterase
MTADEIMAATRANPGPFLFKMDEHPQKENLWKTYESFIRASDPMVQGMFLQSFYADPNPMKEGLRQIKCPTLILIGEFDLAFLEPSKIMAEEIPDNRHVIMNGIGHMTAMEDPDGTIKEILDFLETVKETGKARRV